MTNPTTTPLTDEQLDEIEAKAAYLRDRLDRKNPWPSDNESHWMAEGWKSGTRNALDKLRPDLLVAEVRRLQQQRRFLIDQLAKKDAACGDGDRALAEFLAADPDEGEPAASSV